MRMLPLVILCAISGDQVGYWIGRNIGTAMFKPDARFLKHFARDGQRRHGGGPAGIKRQVGDGFDQFVLGDAIVQGAADVALEFVGAARGDKHRHSDQAAVSLGQLFPLPDVTEEHLVA